MRALPDPEVLVLANGQRILVTDDSYTMPRHFRELIALGNHSPGVLVIPQRLPIGTAIDELVTVWLASEPEEWVNQIAWLPL